MSLNDRGRIARLTNERGAILPLMAIVLVVLLGAAAMAVDLGWLYWQSIEIQQGADAAALSGVIYEPDERDEAHAQGMAAAVENGFVHDPLNGNLIEVIDFADDPTAVQHGAQLRATVTQRVPTFFMKVFGIGSVDISRTALAEYVRPLALGSPEASFGTDPETGYDPGMWASIKGTYGPKSHGDRYAALCLNSEWGVSCTPNPEARPTVSPGTIDATGGYLYGIEVGDGASGLKVETFDAPFYDGNSVFEFAGDAGNGANPDLPMWFMLYGPDATPLDTTDGNELLCVVKYDARENRTDDFPWWNPAWTSFSELSAGELSQLWDDMANSAIGNFVSPGCAGSFDRGPGIYPLRVVVEHDDDWWTSNKFSLRTSTTSGPAPMVYGLGDMSIYTNVDMGLTEFYLTRVEQAHAGRTLVVEFWDAGDVNSGGSGDTLTILRGSGAMPDCSWAASNGDSGSTCVINVSAKKYNNELITVTIPIPDDYTCSGDECWFRVNYDYTGTQVHDTTSWTAYITGNPIRLIE